MEMESNQEKREGRAVWIIAGALLLALALFLLFPRVKEELEPRPTVVRVAIEVAGEGVARDGAVELASGTGFILHAVLEAETRGGEKVYYTEAPALELAGEAIPAGALRRWDRPLLPKVRWFTVEGTPRYLEAAAEEDLARFHFEEVFRPDWPETWSIPGRVDARTANAAETFTEERFGTQRYHVRVELYRAEDDLVPAERYRSPGAELLPESAADFPTVTLGLGGLLGPASEIFGLSLIEPAEGAPEAVRRRAAELTRRRLAFARLPLLAETIAGVGDLTWSAVDLSAGPAWGEGPGRVRPGDLLQVLDRVVMLYRDRGTEGAGAGVLDYGDLCFDFYRGAAVRPLSEVFTGGGEVTWASAGGS